MTRKPWNPIHPDGTVNDTELSAPVITEEQTTWVISEDIIGVVAAGALLELMASPVFAHAFSRHRFIVPLLNAVGTAHWNMFVLPPTADKYLTKHPANVTCWEDQCLSTT